jgi:hypothetical protein
MGLPDCQFVNNVASGYNPVVHGLGRWILNTTPWLLTLGLVLRTWEDGHTWITAVVAGGLLAMAAADFAGTVWATPRSHFSVPALGAALLGAAAFFLAWLDRASPSYSHPRSHSAFLAVVAVCLSERGRRDTAATWAMALQVSPLGASGEGGLLHLRLRLEGQLQRGLPRMWGTHRYRLITTHGRPGIAWFFVSPHCPRPPLCEVWHDPSLKL